MMRPPQPAAPPRRPRRLLTGFKISLLVLVALVVPTLVVFAFMHSLPDSRGGEFRTHDNAKGRGLGSQLGRPMFGGSGGDSGLGGLGSMLSGGRAVKQQEGQQQHRGGAVHDRRSTEIDGAIIRADSQLPAQPADGGSTQPGVQAPPSPMTAGTWGGGGQEGSEGSGDDGSSGGGSRPVRPSPPPRIAMREWRQRARSQAEQAAEAEAEQAAAQRRLQDGLGTQQGTQQQATQQQGAQQGMQQQGTQQQGAQQGQLQGQGQVHPQHYHRHVEPQKQYPPWTDTLLRAGGKPLPRPNCRDRQPAKDCQAWAKRGECESRPEFMFGSCAASCGLCRTAYLHGSEVAQQVELMPGVMMPMVGYGTAGLTDLTADAVFTAIRVGYRLIDSAGAREWYREDLVGWGWSASGIKREHLFITSKIHPRHHGYWSMLEVFSEALQDLQTDYVDLMLLHYPECWPELCGDVKVEGTWRDSWAALEQLVLEKKLRAIGVSNFNLQQMRELVGMAKVKPALLQANSDLLRQDWELQAFCKLHGIQFQAYSSLGGQWLVQTQGTWNPVLEHPVLLQIAAAHKKTPAQVALRWALQHGQAVVPRTTKVNRLEENLALFDFDLSDGEMQLLDSLDGTQPVPPGQPQVATAAVAAAQRAVAAANAQDLGGGPAVGGRPYQHGHVQAAGTKQQQQQQGRGQAAHAGQTANTHTQQAAAQQANAKQQAQAQAANAQAHVQAHAQAQQQQAQAANARQQAQAQAAHAQAHVQAQAQSQQARAQAANARQQAQAQVQQQHAAAGGATATQRRRQALTFRR
ncbi:hypothetical protein ABPG75_007207 [Micractinium tetrahymenae]